MTAPAPASPSAAADAAPRSRMAHAAQGGRALAALGAVALAIGLFLPFLSSDAFGEIEERTLFDLAPRSDVTLLVLAILALVFVILSAGLLPRVLLVAAGAIGAFAVGQLAPLDGNEFDVYGAGLWVSLAGGVVLWAGALFAAAFSAGADEARPAVTPVSAPDGEPSDAGVARSEPGSEQATVSLEKPPADRAPRAAPGDGAQRE